MGVSDFRFKRHLRLWEEQNKAVKRTMIVALLLGLLLPLKVLKPMTEISQKTVDERSELQASIEKKEVIGDLETALDEMEITFSDVQSTMAREPWNEEKDRLIHTYQEMNRDRISPPSRGEIQAEADKAVMAIGGMVREQIIDPLEESLPRDSDLRVYFQPLSDYMTDLNRDIKQWESERIGNVWYGTISGKNEAVAMLTDNLSDWLRALPQLLQQEHAKIDGQRRELEIRTTSIETEIEKRQSNLGDLESQMQQILPGWLRGIVGIREMIQIFPALLLALTLYIFWLAISLTRHFNLVAGEVDLSKEDKKDPSTSSTWTLTNRGQVGTLITVTAYMFFTIIMWGGFEWGYRLLNSWLTDNNSIWYGALVRTNGFLWFGRIMLSFCLIFIVFRKTIFEEMSERLKNVLGRKPAG